MSSVKSIPQGLPSRPSLDTFLDEIGGVKHLDKSLNFKTEALLYVFGDAPKFWEIHNNKPWRSKYGPLKVFESIMRGIAQVCFANNPWSGVLILIGLTKADPYVGLGVIIASFASLMMSLILRQKDAVIVAGLQNYSAVLVGSVTVALFPVFFTQPMDLMVWFGIFVMGALSVCVGLGFAHLLAPQKLPIYTLPFNVTTALLFLAFRGAGYATPLKSAKLDPFNAVLSDVPVDWAQVAGGCFLSAGQVYAVQDYYCSVLVLVGLIINSPLLTLALFVGGSVSTITGIFVSTAPYTSIYGGVWGYNGFLAAGCMAFFVTPTPISMLLAVLNPIFAAFIHAGLVPLFGANNIPVYTYPFCMTSLLFLSIIAEVPGEERVAMLTFPEQHLMKKRKEEKMKKMMMDATNAEMDTAL